MYANKCSKYFTKIRTVKLRLLQCIKILCYFLLTNSSGMLTYYFKICICKQTRKLLTFQYQIPVECFSDQNDFFPYTDIQFVQRCALIGSYIYGVFNNLDIVWSIRMSSRKRRHQRRQFRVTYCVHFLFSFGLTNFHNTMFHYLVIANY